MQLNSRSLLASAYIVYLPDVTEQQARSVKQALLSILNRLIHHCQTIILNFICRERLKKWGALIGFDDESFSVLNFLSTPEKQLKWEADGLPSDTSAIKNAVLIDQVNIDFVTFRIIEFTFVAFNNIMHFLKELPVVAIWLN